MAAEYGHKHLAKTIMAKDLDATIRRMFHDARIALASWRGYATMLHGRVQYVGKSCTFNKVQRQVRLVEQVDMGTLGSWSCAHLVDRPLPVIFPKGWVFYIYYTTCSCDRLQINVILEPQSKTPTPY